MSLKEIRLSAIFGNKFQKQFNCETWALSELFWSLLSKSETGIIQKCNIIVDENWENQDYEFPVHVNVALIKQIFDFNLYFQLNSKYEKKKMQLEVLYKGIIEIGLIQGWEIEPINQAYNRCKELNLEYAFFIKNSFKKSPNKKYKAGIWCEWDIDIFNSYLIIFNKDDNETGKQLIISKEPQNGESMYYSELKWLGNDKILIKDKIDDKKWEFDISSTI